MENKIHKVFEAFLNDANSDKSKYRSNSRIWTSGILERLAELGDKEDYWVSGGGHDRQWLFDLVWYRITSNDKNTERLKSIGLVVESEWGDISDIKYDFEKLLIANSKHKLIICWAPHLNDIVIYEDYFKKAIQDYELGLNDEKYFTAIFYDNIQNNRWEVKFKVLKKS